MQYPHASHCEISTNHRPSLNRLLEKFNQSQANSQPPIGKFRPMTGQLSNPPWKISTNESTASAASMTSHTRPPRLDDVTRDEMPPGWEERCTLDGQVSSRFLIRYFSISHTPLGVVCIISIFYIINICIISIFYSIYNINNL